jgi:hypothetical protein
MKLSILSNLAKLLGIQFSVNGIPYGATVKRESGVAGEVSSPSVS